MKLSTFTTPRLNIRDFYQKDIQPFFQYRADTEVARYQSWSDFSLEDAENFFQAQQQAIFTRKDSWYQIAIAEKDSDRLIGDFAFHFLDEEPPQLEIGFTFSTAFQGKGYANEALTALVEYAFSQLNIHRIIAITDTKNAAAEQLLTACRFRKEAHYINNIFFKGSWGDEFLFALLKQEWQEMNKS